MAERLISLCRSAVPFITLIVIWWLLTSGFKVVSRYFLPGPDIVWDAFVQGLSDGSIVEGLGISLLRLIASFCAGAVAGVAVGVLMGLVPGIGRFCRPLISFFNSLSGITWLPLAIAWLGIGWMTTGFIMFNSVFFLVALTTLSGVQIVPKVYEHALLTMGGSKLQVVTQVLIPGAMPSIMTGLRLGIGFAWRALIAVEMMAASGGMGYLIFKASYDFRQDALLAGILVVGVIAMIIDRVLLEPIERRTIERWGLV